MSQKTNHILIGRNLLLKKDQIVSANLSAEKDDKPFIKVTLENDVEWTVFSYLEESKEILKSLAEEEKSKAILKEIKYCVNRPRVGRESNLSKEIKQILQEDR